MMKIEQKKTLTIFGADRLDLNQDLPFNVIVAGASRGGTSAVASTMRALGLNLGDGLHPTTHEDMEFADLLNYGELSYESWRSLIEKRVKAFPGWSMKLPGALRMINAFENTLPNPLYVILVRNPFGVARSLVQRDPEYGDGMLDYMRGYSHAVEMYADCFRNIGLIKGAFAVCEYEQLMRSPNKFVSEFAALCRIPVTPTVAAAAEELINSPGYKNMQATHVPHITGDKVPPGWNS